MFDKKKSNYVNMLKKGLFLDDYNVLIEWDIEESELKQKIILFNNLSITENHPLKTITYSLQSKILNSETPFMLSFHFKEGKLRAVYLSGGSTDVCAEKYFDAIQNFLESKLGKPNYLYILDKLFSDKEDIIYGWKIGKIKIKHQLFDLKSRTTLEIMVLDER